jgi:Protein of unknown function (DUF1566)
VAGRHYVLVLSHTLSFQLFERKYHIMKIKHLLAALLLPIAWCASAAPFAVSADGQEVTDAKTGLIWRRCAEGSTASVGTCTGTATFFTHEEALALASAQGTVTGVAWRLPNVKELSSITDKNRINPAFDTVAFPDPPARPARLFWSSTPYAGNPSMAWLVGFGDGSVAAGLRFDPFYYVRLVRAGQ